VSVVVSLYSTNNHEISRFLTSYNEEKISNVLEWKKEYKNPIEIADIIGVFIDNNENYDINMWISLDNGFFLNVTNNNANQIIKYLFERYPY
jgi:hypothetical protein